MYWHGRGILGRRNDWRMTFSSVVVARVPGEHGLRDSALLFRLSEHQDQECNNAPPKRRAKSRQRHGVDDWQIASDRVP